MCGEGSSRCMWLVRGDLDYTIVSIWAVLYAIFPQAEIGHFSSHPVFD